MVTDPIDFGGGVLSGSGDDDAFLVKLGPTGEHLWSHRFGAGDRQTIASLAIADDDSIVVTGQCRGTNDFGGGPISAPDEATDILLARYDTNGEHLWSRCLFSGSTWYDSKLALAPGGDIVVVAPFQSVADFGGGVLHGVGIDDMVLARFNLDGEHLWSRSFGGQYVDYPYDLAITASGHIVLSGLLSKGIDFGGGPIKAGSDADFVAQFNADGDLMWDLPFLDGTSVRVGGLAAAGDDVILMGAYNHSTVIAGLPLPPPVDEFDGFVARMNSKGAPLWAKPFPGAHFGGGEVNAAGELVLASSFSETDYGGGPSSDPTGILPSSSWTGTASSCGPARSADPAGSRPTPHAWIRRGGSPSSARPHPTSTSAPAR
ncbi:hypothetical protein [Nannocystis pusilla]|uniref:hypothetical protein n=1 Tax=Nannocystis pusilla TaxID=889268 RepID=UPI003B7BA414